MSDKGVLLEPFPPTMMKACRLRLFSLCVIGILNSNAHLLAAISTAETGELRPGGVAAKLAGGDGVDQVKVSRFNLEPLRSVFRGSRVSAALTSMSVTA